MMRRSNSQAGFTLIELLLAMALLAFLMVVMSAAIDAATRFLERSTDVGQVTDDATSTYHIRRWIEEAAAIQVEREDGSSFVPFYGRPDQIEFVRIEEGLAQSGGLFRYRLSLIPGADGTRRLQLERWPLARVTDRLGEDTQIVRRVLLSKLSDARFSYAKTGGWLGVWRPQENLPELVRLSYRRGDQAMVHHIRPAHR